MSARNDGGRAFPSDTRRTHEFGSTGSTHEGMSLRDYFAAKAVAALIAEPQWQGSTPSAITFTRDADGCCSCEVDRYAIAAYRMADAMLRARGAA